MRKAIIEPARRNGRSLKPGWTSYADIHRLPSVDAVLKAMSERRADLLRVLNRPVIPIAPAVPLNITWDSWSGGANRALWCWPSGTDLAGRCAGIDQENQELSFAAGKGTSLGDQRVPVRRLRCDSPSLRCELGSLLGRGGSVQGGGFGGSSRGDRSAGFNLRHRPRGPAEPGGHDRNDQ